MYRRLIFCAQIAVLVAIPGCSRGDDADADRDTTVSGGAMGNTLGGAGGSGGSHFTGGLTGAAGNGGLGATAAGGAGLSGAGGTTGATDGGASGGQQQSGGSSPGGASGKDSGGQAGSSDSLGGAGGVVTGGSAGTAGACCRREYESDVECGGNGEGGTIWPPHAYLCTCNDRSDCKQRSGAGLIVVLCCP